MNNDFNPDEFLPYRLARVSEALDAHFEAFTRQAFDLTWPEWQVLVILGRSDNSTAKAIAAKSQLNKTKVSRAIGMLEHRSFLARSRDRSDRRVELLQLTALGRERHARALQMAQDYEALLIKLLGEADARQLREALTAAAEAAMGYGIDFANLPEEHDD